MKKGPYFDMRIGSNKRFLKSALRKYWVLLMAGGTVAILMAYMLFIGFADSGNSKWGSVVIVTAIGVQTILVCYATSRIRLSEQRYRSLFEHHADAILSFDINGKLVNTNNQFGLLYGYGADDLRNMDMRSIIEPSAIPKATECFLACLSGTTSHIDMTVIHRLGHRIDVSVTFVPMMTGGEIVGVYLVSKDITDTKQHKKEIERLHRHYQLLLNSVSEGIVGVGKDFTINFWNDAAVRMTGWREDEAKRHRVYTVLRHTTFDGTPIDDDTCPFHLSMFDGQARSVKDALMWRKDGSSFPAELVVSPIKKDDGPHIGLVCMFKDVTDNKKTEELLRKSDKLSAVGQLAAGVAHEIRNPLTALKGFLRLLPSMSPKEQGYLAIMDRELLRIESIVNEFLFVARPQTTHFAPHEISGILSDTVELLKLQALMNGVEISASYEPNLPVVQCDEHQLKQVFINIMKNALESMPAGGDMFIHASLLPGRGELLIRIKDTGCGIAPDRLVQLGEPFYSTKEKGTGLGLMVSYKILEAHNGYMRFNSKLNVGTQVDIYLPAAN